IPRMVGSLSVEHSLAGGAGQRDLEIGRERAARPERERSEARPVRGKLGHERIGYIERHGQVLHEQGEEPVSSVGDNALHNRAQSCIFRKRVRFDHTPPWRLDDLHRPVRVAPPVRVHKSASVWRLAWLPGTETLEERTPDRRRWWLGRWPP